MTEQLAWRRQLLGPSLLLAAPTLAAILHLAMPERVGGVALLALALLAPLGGMMITGAHHRALRPLLVAIRRLADQPDRPLGLPGGPPRDVLGDLAAAVARVQRAMVRRQSQCDARLTTLEALFDALPDPVIMVDHERRIGRINRASRNLLGEPVLGRDLAAALRQPAILAAVDAVLAGASTRAVEMVLPGAVERTFEARITPFRADTSEADPARAALAQLSATPGETAPVAERRGIGALLSFHDITAMRRSEQLRADFVANASHELRTPLSSLLGFIETLRGPARDDQEAQERFLGIMHEQASRMARLIADLLSLSRIELDEHLPPTGRVDLAQVVRTVAAALELKAAERRITLLIEVAETLPPVTGDEDQLTQVVQNLVSNALKYTREQTEIAIRISASDATAIGGAPALPGGSRPGRAPQPMLALAVADQGDGIARTHLPRLTERFYRVDPARSRALGGTGLGLAIVKHIVNRHRGRLIIDSELGRGSTFTVWLPVAPPQLEVTRLELGGRGLPGPGRSISQRPPASSASR